MSHSFFERHQALLLQAMFTTDKRGYWSTYTEMPSLKVYGDNPNAEAKAAFDARLKKPFALTQAATIGAVGSEVSPYGFKLGITYPKADLDQLFAAIRAALPAWHKAGPKAWVGVSLEILQRLNERSLDIAHAVMHTTGQAYMTAFQVGGPHAQDRGLEAVAYAWREMNRIPTIAYWEKPQGKNEPLKMENRYSIVPRGIGLVIGCCTFPTWNTYPGLFASLATGNAVIVKPHPGAILPLAITVQIARDVLQEAGFDPHIVTLVAHAPDDDTATTLTTHPAVGLIDFRGSSANGNWVQRNTQQAQVFTENGGFNQIVIDSRDDMKGIERNIGSSLALYSGQMCTAPQNLSIPEDGIDTPAGHVGYEQMV